MYVASRLYLNMKVSAHFCAVLCKQFGGEMKPSWQAVRMVHIYKRIKPVIFIYSKIPLYFCLRSIMLPTFDRPQQSEEVEIGFSKQTLFVNRGIIGH